MPYKNRHREQPAVALQSEQSEPLDFTFSREKRLLFMVRTGTSSPPEQPDLLSSAHPSVTREHFIPLRKRDLLALWNQTLSTKERDELAALARILDAVVHHTYHERFNALCDSYAPFDPDSDLAASAALAQADGETQLVKLFVQFRELLISANFVQLSQADIDEAMQAATDWGLNLHVDHSHFEKLEVYARGDTVARRVRRRWWNWMRTEVIEIPIFKRLAVIFRLKIEETHEHASRHPRTNTHGLPVFIKLFKNVPKMDVDMLLPGTHVQMTWFDRGKIMLPTVSGLVLAGIKIAKGAVVFAFAGIYGLLAFLVFVVGTIGYGVKSFFGYLHTKDKYHLNLTRNLYYQNLDNNAGVLARVLHEAEEQDFREALLAYLLLWQHAGPHGFTERELDRAAESWLENTLGTPVDFEIHDALDKLRRWQMVEEVADSRFVATPPAEACRRLDHLWDQWFTA